MILPFIDYKIPCGFPSPALDYEQKPLNIEEILITNKDTCFTFRMTNDSMEGAKIFEWDYVVVDRAVNPKSWDIVVACLGGEFTCKELVKGENGYYLIPHNPKYQPIYPREGDDFTVWGKVISDFRSFIHRW